MPRSIKRIFLSYAQADAAWAEELREHLGRAGFEVYPSQNWPQDVSEAIGQADFVVPVLSRHASKSLWVQREIERAILDPHLKNKVFVVILDRDAQFPWVLRTVPSVSESDADRAANKLSRLLRKSA